MFACIKASLLMAAEDKMLASNSRQQAGTDNGMFCRLFRS